MLFSLFQKFFYELSHQNPQNPIYKTKYYNYGRNNPKTTSSITKQESKKSIYIDIATFIEEHPYLFF